MPCPYCEKYIEDFQSILSLYTQLPDKEPSQKITARILRRAKKMHIPAPYRRRSIVIRRVRWAIPVLAGAVAFFLFMILPHLGKTAWENSFDIDTRIQEIESELAMMSEEW